ncbi:MAG: cell division protein FtsA [candidate division Zixibacteria bacterium]|nr:cell division protein FtsA [candidate division Zixibacteria bacterium]
MIQRHRGGLMGKNIVFTVVDIGSTKVTCLIASRNGQEDLEVIGSGTVQVENIYRKGILKNIDRASLAISEAVAKAESEAQLRVSNLTVGFSGDHLRSLNSLGVVAVSKTQNQIGEQDVESVIEAAQAINLPFEREILHVLPQEFYIDQGDGVRDPIGNTGVRLEVQVHIVTASTAATQAIYKAVRNAGFEITNLVMNPIVVGSSLLSAEEEEVGTLLLDIGGSTADVAVYHKGAVRHTASIGIGGKYVTNDIAVGLQIPYGLAEQIKLSHGHCFPADIGPDEMIDIPEIGGRKKSRISRVLLASIIEARMEEIFSLALNAARRSGYTDKLACGLILTGGGARLRGIDRLAEQVFSLPVKIGYPEKVNLPEEICGKPEYSAAVGLLAYSLRHPLEQENRRNLFARMFNKVEEVISSLFNI